MTVEDRLANLYRGDSRRIRINVSDSAGAPISLATKKAVLTIAKTHQGTPIDVWTNLSSDHEDAEGGITVFDLSPDTFYEGGAGNYHVDVVIYETEGATDIQTVFIGQLRVLDRVAIPEIVN